MTAVDPLAGRIAFPIADDAAIVRRPAARILLELAELGLRAHVRDGIRQSAAVREITSTMVAISGRSGHADVRHESGLPALSADEIGTREAAVMLGTSQRHANRLASDGHLGRTRKAGNRRLVSRAEVEAYAAMRTTAVTR